MYDAGSQLRTVRAVSPQFAAATATVEGVVIDGLGFRSAVFTAITGAATGTPTGISVACRLQHGTLANGSDMADVTGATATITAVDSAAEINVTLRGLRRYVRIVQALALTGGTTPTLAVAATATLGQPKVGPA